jgi:hypothetical protein
LLQASIRMAERMHLGATYAVVEAATDHAPDNPLSNCWIRLIVYLYSHVPSRRAAIMGTSSIEGSGLSGVDLAGILDKAGYETITYAAQTPIPDDVGVLIASASGAAQEFAERRPAVVITEVADGFAQRVGELRDRGYHWYLVVQEDVVQDDPANSDGSFYSNYPFRVPGATGHVFFFRDRETFVEAQSWCAALLRRTYFRFLSGGPD